MTTLSGTLNINARGAQLHCSLGCFIIRDEQLTRIASGKYRGFFDIQKILPHAITNTCDTFNCCSSSGTQSAQSNAVVTSNEGRKQEGRD